MHVLSTPPAFVLSQDQTLRKRIDPAGLCPSGLCVRIRVIRSTLRSHRDPVVVLMTGVHWLLAHCSVLKVRTLAGFPSWRRPFRQRRKPPAREPTASAASGLRDRLRQTPSLSCSIVRKMAPIRILLPGPSQGPIANGTAMARMASTTGHPRHTSQAPLAVTSYFDELPPSDLQDLALHVPHVHLEVGVLDLLSIDPDTSLLDLPSPFGV